MAYKKKETKSRKRSKYDKYMEQFISYYLTGKVERFVDYAKEKGWIKHTLSENGYMAQIGLNWEAEAERRFRKIEQRVQQKVEKELEITIEEALKLKRKAIDSMNHRIKIKDNSLFGLTIEESKRAWEVGRTEARQPISITNQMLGEDPNHPFNSIADAVRATENKQSDTTIDEKPAK